MSFGEFKIVSSLVGGALALSFAYRAMPAQEVPYVSEYTKAIPDIVAAAPAKDGSGYNTGGAKIVQGADETSYRVPVALGWIPAAQSQNVLNGTFNNTDPIAKRLAQEAAAKAKEKPVRKRDLAASLFSWDFN